jgi:hypothetical protein
MPKLLLAADSLVLDDVKNGRLPSGFHTYT